MTVRLLAPLIVLMIVPACQKTFAAVVANPCASELRVATYSAPEPNDDVRGNEAVVPAKRAIEIPHAFYGDGTLSWSISLVDIDVTLAVDAERILDGDEVIVVPAVVCEQLP